MEEAPAKKSDKHLARQVRQSMPTASCPVQVYINEPKKSRAGSIVSWSMAALKGTLHDKCMSSGVLYWELCTHTFVVALGVTYTCKCCYIESYMHLHMWLC